MHRIKVFKIRVVFFKIHFVSKRAFRSFHESSLQKSDATRLVKELSPCTFVILIPWHLADILCRFSNYNEQQVLIIQWVQFW